MYAANQVPLHRAAAGGFPEPVIFAWGYGTIVTNGITGVVNDTGASTVENNFGTYNCSDGNTYLGLSWGSDTKSLTLIDGQVVKGTQKNLDEAAAEVTAAGPTRDGYRLTGYTWLTSDGAKVTDTANYTMNAPTWLTSSSAATPTTSSSQRQRTSSRTPKQHPAPQMGAGFLRCAVQRNLIRCVHTYQAGPMA